MLWGFSFRGINLTKLNNKHEYSPSTPHILSPRGLPCKWKRDSPQQGENNNKIVKYRVALRPKSALHRFWVKAYWSQWKDSHEHQCALDQTLSTNLKLNENILFSYFALIWHKCTVLYLSGNYPQPCLNHLQAELLSGTHIAIGRNSALTCNIGT